MTNATFLTPLQQARLKFTYDPAEILVQAFDAPCNVEACKNDRFIELVRYAYEQTPRYQQLTRTFVHALELNPATPVGQWDERQSLTPKLIQFLTAQAVLPIRVGFIYYYNHKAEPYRELVAHIRRDAIALYLPNGRLNAWAISYHGGTPGDYIIDTNGAHGALYDEAGRCCARVRLTSKTICNTVGGCVPVRVPVFPAHSR